DKLPIGVSLDGRSHVLLYLLSEPIGDDFRIFLRRHAELLRALPAWSIRLLVPTGVESEVVNVYEAVFREELATPLHPTVANELRWFYQSADITGTADATRFRRARRAFVGRRFGAIRKAWLQDGDRVVDVAMSTSLADAIARESGRIERHELSRPHFHSPS